MFRTVPLSIIRSFPLYTRQWYRSYRFAVWRSMHNGCVTYTIAVCTVENSWWWTEELSETCRVSFQNKFEKLVYLVGFIIRNLSWCTVTWTSNADLTFANTIKTELLQMARANDTLFMYIVNVKEWKNTEEKIKRILSCHSVTTEYPNYL